jgi:hypothetical protein
MGRFVGRCGYRAALARRCVGLMLGALVLALCPAPSTARPWQVEQPYQRLRDEQLPGPPGVLPDVSSPVVAGYWGSDEEIRNAGIVIYSVLGVTGFTILFNGTYAVTRKRAPTFVRVLGGVLGTIELVPGVLLLIYPDDRDAGAILTSLGGAALLAALLSGGKKQDKTVLVAPTSDGGAVMSMSWRF